METSIFVTDLAQQFLLAWAMYVNRWFSCFTTISTPVSALSKGQAYCGVGVTIARISGITLSSSASVNISAPPCPLAAYR